MPCRRLAVVRPAALRLRAAATAASSSSSSTSVTVVTVAVARMVACTCVRMVCCARCRITLVCSACTMPFLLALRDMKPVRCCFCRFSRNLARFSISAFSAASDAPPPAPVVSDSRRDLLQSSKNDTISVYTFMMPDACVSMSFAFFSRAPATMASLAASGVRPTSVKMATTRCASFRSSASPVCMFRCRPTAERSGNSTLGDTSATGAVGASREGDT